MKKTLTAFHSSLTDKDRKTLKEKLLSEVTSLESYKKAKTILAYIPDRLEADCTLIIEDALKKGKKVCVPKVNASSLSEGKSEMDFYYLEKGKKLEEQLATGCYGIKEPLEGLKIYHLPEEREYDLSRTLSAPSNTEPAPTSPAAPSVFMLVPGVAFSLDGKRLGHGKGFYDIYIERMKKAGQEPYLCGICLFCQIKENIPTDSHDIPMDKVIAAEPGE